MYIHSTRDKATQSKRNSISHIEVKLSIGGGSKKKELEVKSD
jgi:hypothetical protein